MVMHQDSAEKTDKKRRSSLDMRKIIIALVLMLLFFVAGVRFGDYLSGNSPTADGESAETVGVKVDVKGAVESPGVYQFPEGSRVEDALATLELKADAEPALLNAAAILEDGSELIIPYSNGDIDWNALAQSRGGDYYGTPASSGGTTDSMAGVGVININTASIEELQQLSGIGEVKAQNIIDHREANGPFVTIEQIMDVSGIGTATFEKIKEHISVE